MECVVVVSGGVAETVQCAALIRALAAASGRPVLLACPPAAAELARLLHGVGAVLPVAALRDGRGWPGGVWAALRGRRLDIAVVCSERAGVRAAVYLAAVPRRLGCRGGISDALLTDVLPSAPADNRGLAWAALASLLDAPPAPPLAGPLLTVDPGLAAVAERRLLETGIGDGRLLVAIAPGQGFADHAGETWRPERWAHLANRLGARHGSGVILLGGEGDRDAAEAMRVDLAATSVDLCGELDLAGAAAVIARCDLLVAVDGPLLQVAAAVGTPSVGLFAARDGRRGGPPGPDHRVVQALPHEGPASLEQVRVDDVLAAIEGSA